MGKKYNKHKRRFGPKRNPDDYPVNSLSLEEGEQGYVDFPMVIPDPFVQDLITELRKPWIDTKSSTPWQSNSDFEFLSRVWSNPSHARFLNLRRSLAISTDMSFVWDDVIDRETIDEIGVERLFKHIFGQRDFLLQDWFNFAWLAKCTGLEGVETELRQEPDGLVVPVHAYHIDNRRFKIFRHPIKAGAYELGIIQPGNIKARSLTEFEKERIAIIRNECYEYTMGYGRGIFTHIYFAWRFKTFLEVIMQRYAEKFAIPFITFSMAVGHSAALGTGNVPGKRLVQILKSYVDNFQKVKSGGIFGLPFPAEINVIDVGQNKLRELKEIAEYLDQHIGDCICGSANIVQSQKSTFGAHKSQSQIAMQFILEDREFLKHQFNKFLLPLLYKYNEEKFAELGLTRKKGLPNAAFIYHEIDPKDQIDKLYVVKDMGYTVTQEVLQKIVGFDVIKVEDDDFGPLNGDLPARYEEKKHRRDRSGKFREKPEDPSSKERDNSDDSSGK